MVRHWFGAHDSGRAAISPYEVACACGTLLRGARQARYQVPRCAQCGRDVFVLPWSPLPPARAARDERTPAPTARPEDEGQRTTDKSRLLLPVVLFSLSLVLAAGVLWWARGPGSGKKPAGGSDLDEVRTRIVAGAKALGEGNSQLAVDELEVARQLVRRHPHLVSKGEARQLAQLHNQATLLADLLTESLGELLSRAVGLEEREWQAVFQRRYSGKAVLFDAEVRRDGAGQYQLGYRLWAGLEPGRAAIEDLTLLANLPLEKPQRLLFGARLAAIRREPPGIWVVRFDPGSGVLLTHAGAVTACLFNPPDAELQQVLALQEMWLAELP
jgi:hypothetical protein